MRLSDTEFPIHIKGYIVNLDADNFALRLNGNSQALEKSFTEFNKNFEIQLNIFSPEWTNKGSFHYTPYGYDEMFYEDSKLKTIISATAFYSDHNLLCIDTCVNQNYLLQIRDQLEKFSGGDSKIFCTV